MPKVSLPPKNLSTAESASQLVQELRRWIGNRHYCGLDPTPLVKATKLLRYYIAKYGDVRLEDA